MPARTLILYERRDCHLCEDMAETLEIWRRELGFELERRDVDRHDEWRQRYGSLVPVLFDGDHEVCRYFLDLVALKRAVGRD
jgi:glutaredoxin